MIIDTIAKNNLYTSLNRNFEEAFRYLLNTEISELSVGKHSIKNDEIFAIVFNGNVVMPETIKMESHQKYIDIHYIIKGEEIMGWSSIDNCTQKIGEFNINDDYVLYDDQPTKKLKIVPNEFCILFPSDVHIGGLFTGNIHKIVLKIAI
ncbi:MAG: YhcH/YjgK/YiaL family protein [Bacteroidota bacterium]|nr:YhcH/YjgK/YiaL family protein [Bacteroidota bacterium]